MPNNTWGAIDRPVDVPATLGPFLQAARPPRRPLPVLKVRAAMAAGADLSDVAGTLHRLLVEQTSLTAVGYGGAFGQFSRLATSLAADEHDKPLRRLERLEIPGRVEPGQTGGLAAELGAGLAAVAGIAVSGWELQGRSSRRILTVHPRGTELHVVADDHWGDVSVLLDAERGLLLRHNGRDHVLRAITDGHVDSDIDVPESLAAHLATILGADLTVSPIPAVAVFAEGVGRLIDLLEQADERGEAVVAFNADPTTLGVLKPN
jgi:hypothetical protein